MPYKDLEKRKEYGRLWAYEKHKKNKARAFELLGNRCVRCGIDDMRVLEIDHIVPLLRRTSGADSGTTLARDVASGKLPAESVQLLCSNCHTIKTYHE